MLASEHDETRAMAQQYTVCMGNLARDLRDYISAWPDAVRIASSAAEFCTDTQHLLDMLETRINREERALYPQAEQLVSA